MPTIADTTAPALPAARFRLPALPRNEVPGALLADAGFAAFFGTLWLVQGLRPAGGLPAAALGLLPGVATAAYLRCTRRVPLALAPVVRRAHILAVGTAPALLPLLTITLLRGTERTVVTGLAGGSVYLTKAIIDLRISRQG